ncbi:MULTISPECIES: ATP-binding protein [Nocardia]|uniref:ATP-binding protein n=1 Tax=Nocardia TaxID=1817 RepID=UPI001E42E19B|nr:MULTISPECIES: ATP-binding protein [Nocardia]
MQSASETLSDTTTVRIQVPARREQLALMRALADAVTVDAEFRPEDIADIRLVLNEVATALVVDAVPGSMIDCRFTYDKNRMSVEVDSAAWANSGVTQRDFAWRIVRTLTHDATASQEPFDITVSGYPTHVEFDWRRGAPTTNESNDSGDQD